MERKKKKIEKIMEGCVKGKSVNNTVKVEVHVSKRDKLYSKIIRRKKRYLAQCNIELEAGDKVILKETRPLSKNKRWIVVKKILKNNDSIA